MACGTVRYDTDLLRVARCRDRVGLPMVAAEVSPRLSLYLRRSLVTPCHGNALPVVDRQPCARRAPVHSGAGVLLSAQAAEPERPAGLLVMRRSGVRFPKAAQVKSLISLVCSVAVGRSRRSMDIVSCPSPRRHAVTKSENQEGPLVSLLDAIRPDRAAQKLAGREYGRCGSTDPLPGSGGPAPAWPCPRP